MSGSGDTAERDRTVITLYGDSNDTYPGEHVMIWVPVDLLGSVPDTNITLYISYHSIKKKRKKKGEDQNEIYSYKA